MKKTILVSALVFVMSFSAKAQLAQIGVKAGLNYDIYKKLQIGLILKNSYGHALHPAIAGRRFSASVGGSRRRFQICVEIPRCGTRRESFDLRIDWRQDLAGFGIPNSGIGVCKSFV